MGIVPKKFNFKTEFCILTLTFIQLYQFKMTLNLEILLVNISNNQPQLLYSTSIKSSNSGGLKEGGSGPL